MHAYLCCLKVFCVCGASHTRSDFLVRTGGQDEAQDGQDEAHDTQEEVEEELPPGADASCIGDISLYIYMHT